MDLRWEITYNNVQTEIFKVKISTYITHINEYRWC